MWDLTWIMCCRHLDECRHSMEECELSEGQKPTAAWCTVLQSAKLCELMSVLVSLTQWEFVWHFYHNEQSYCNVALVSLLWPQLCLCEIHRSVFVLERRLWCWYWWLVTVCSLEQWCCVCVPLPFCCVITTSVWADCFPLLLFLFTSMNFNATRAVMLCMLTLAFRLCNSYFRFSLNCAPAMHLNACRCIFMQLHTTSTRAVTYTNTAPCQHDSAGIWGIACMHGTGLAQVLHYPWAQHKP